MIIDHLPEEVEKVAETAKISPDVHDVIRTTILRDELYEYRPYKAPAKPMVLSRLIDQCQRLAGQTSSTVDNMVTRNTYFSLPFRRSSRVLSMETTLDNVVWRKPSSSENHSLATSESLQAEVPSIAPLTFDASLFANVQDIRLNYRE